jgi:aldehyde dehydrogenase (NAD+)
VEIVRGYLDLAEKDGLQIVARGALVEHAPAGGHYIAPALIAGPSPDHRLAQEEIFGPAQVVIPFDDEDEAVALANGTPYGLGRAPGPATARASSASRTA